MRTSPRLSLATTVFVAVSGLVLLLAGVTLRAATSPVPAARASARIG